jgi:mannose-6-phosphate isomerase-like protein (cupin superfamily)
MSAAAEAPAAQVRYAVGDRDERPWGTWEVLAVGDRYTVKRIVVAAGQRLSLQYHHHRSEDWMILTGLGEVERDGVRETFATGAHVHIAVGTRHRIRNAGQEPLAFIEIQSGDVLDENDIVRLGDDYGRV